ncbi:hypothetical protein QN277_012355 [Acacia crassicarpa]|uniref:Protein kinase domain-containing protein n=1 Tax=Acacia crassicarpa TaxID=499986 RepID=A0AAE1N0V2_9FABA|nr:hypothetical protein QN277_012355 [Acacia crassicarpa]
MVPPIYVLIITFLFCDQVLLSLPSASDDEECPSTFDCGDLGRLGFPLTTGTRQDCGMLAIHGCENPHPYELKTVRFSAGQELLVAGASDGFDEVYLIDTGLEKSFLNESCEAFNTNITLPPTSALGSFVLSDRNQILTLYKCNRTLNITSNYSTYIFNYSGCAESKGETIYYGILNIDEKNVPPSVAACPRIQLPAASETFNSTNPFECLVPGYYIRARLSDHCSLCVSDGGFCRLDAKAQFYCSKSKVHQQKNRDAHNRFSPPPVGGIIENLRPGKTKLIIGLTSGAIGTMLICIIIFCCIIKSLREKLDFLKKSRADQNIEAFIRNQGPLALKRYKYAEVKKMTKSFQVKLGQGGYGAVYKGELLNGYPVAIKLLKLSKGNGEDFINEVASISKTSHINVVTLLGFCLEGRKKALIYEFMSNGSLDRFISNTTNKTSPSVTWENLYEIAIGTARGLEYLYRGCNTRILHFDIKPHNILLDEDFCPKISDFGLAKLCPRKESVVSISEARGTIGYLAPEVWNRKIGRVSHKSDIFSYGMMLLDMVGERNDMNAEDYTTKIYFPDWVYDKLEQGRKLGQDGTNTTEENDIAKKMTIVGLWCIQTFPTQRPTISRVIEMLEGSLESMEMPRKPVMLSPPRLEQESSATCNTNAGGVDSDESSSLMLETH